jgi:hypothetical protein
MDFLRISFILDDGSTFTPGDDGFLYLIAHGLEAPGGRRIVGVREPECPTQMERIYCGGLRASIHDIS